MTVNWLVTAVVLAAVQMWCVWQIVLAVRGLRALSPIEERVGALTRAVTLLVDTTEEGFQAVGVQLSRPSDSPVKATVRRQQRQRRVIGAARNGRTIKQIAEKESVAEGEVAVRLNVARALPGKRQN